MDLPARGLSHGPAAMCNDWLATPKKHLPAAKAMREIAKQHRDAARQDPLNTALHRSATRVGEGGLCASPTSTWSEQ